VDAPLGRLPSRFAAREARPDDLDFALIHPGERDSPGCDVTPIRGCPGSASGEENLRNSARSLPFPRLVTGRPS
jgi:hypothetical protein